MYCVVIPNAEDALFIQTGTAATMAAEGWPRVKNVPRMKFRNRKNLMEEYFKDEAKTDIHNRAFFL